MPDFFHLDALLTSDEKLVRDTFRRFVTDEILPTIGADFRNGTMPTDLPRKLGALGALGANLKTHGCAGLGPIAYGLVMQELERGDSGVRSFASVQGALVMYPIAEFGSDAQRDRWLPRLAKGEAVGCFGLTEPDFGSNPAGMRCTAKKSGSDIVLNGEKRWITSGSIADVALVWARASKEDGEGIGAYLVERGTKGFSTRTIDGKFSLRASITSELVFEDCVIPAANQLPLARGLKSALRCLNEARYGIAWGAAGAAGACYEEALDYTKSRAQFGKPLASHQLVQAKLVDMLESTTNAQLLAWHLGQLKSAGTLRPAHVSLAKRNNVRSALQVARTARDLLGANGITDAYQSGRHMCNLETVFTYEGTDHIHTLIVGEEVTGIAAYS